MTGRRVTPQAEWQVLLKDHYPADMPRLQPWLGEARATEVVQAGG